jgi:AcrR family transcriptional regulator
MLTETPPRPRQARSIATRRKLLDATISCLVECGYAGITTAAVAEAAGVSQGALFKHFPTKSALLGATVEHLFGDLISDYRRAFDAAADDDDDPIGAALRQLDRTFREPRLLAAFELYVVARTDRDLAKALRPVVASHREALRREARSLFPNAADANPDFEAFVDLVLSAMQGRAIGSLVGPDPRADVNELVTLYRLARRELAEGRRR